jgi:hypothetical protein
MRTYGHSEFHGATLQAKIESVLSVERAGDASGGASESASPGSGVSDTRQETLGTEEAAQTIDAAEVLIAERTKFEALQKYYDAQEHEAETAKRPLSEPGIEDGRLSPTWNGRTEDN